MGLLLYLVTQIYRMGRLHILNLFHLRYEAPVASRDSCFSSKMFWSKDTLFLHTLHWPELVIWSCRHAKFLQLSLTFWDSMDCIQPARLLYPWASPGKNTGVGHHALFQRIFSTQGLNLHLFCLLHWQTILFYFNLILFFLKSLMITLSIFSWSKGSHRTIS